MPIRDGRLRGLPRPRNCSFACSPFLIPQLLSLSTRRKGPQKQLSIRIRVCLQAYRNSMKKGPASAARSMSVIDSMTMSAPMPE